jgi:hypothetical protein
MKSYVKFALIGFILFSCTKKEPPIFNVNQQGYILDWVLIGPFPSYELKNQKQNGATRSGYNRDFLKGLGEEKHAILYDGLVTTIEKKNGEKRTVKAKLVGPALEDPDRPDFKRIINNKHILDRDYDEAVAYAFCYLYSDKPQKLFAHMAVDGSPKVWLNDSLVYAKFEKFSKAKDWYYNFEINVKEGKNRFLIKVDNIEQWWGFRIELYNKKQNKLRIKEKVKSVAFSSIETDNKGIDVLVNTVPQLSNYQIHAKLALSKLNGDTLTTKDIITGRSETISLNNFTYTGPVYLEVSPSQKEGNSTKEVSWVGDYHQSLSSLEKKYRDVKNQYKTFIPGRMQKIYKHVFEYYDDFFSQEDHLPNQSFLLNYQFIKRLTNALHRKKDLLSHIPTEAIPIIFKVKGYGNMDLEMPTHISIPENYGTSTKKFPLSIELHGSGGFGKDKPHWPEAHSRIEMKGEPIIILKPGAPRMSYHLQRNYWDPVYLDSILARAKDIFAVNNERIYLNGASGGGKGTWNWINHSPEYFAAAIVLAGCEGYPFRAEKLKYLPLWIINGDLDRASYPFLPEAAVNRLRNIGSNVIFTNFAGLKHHVSSGYDKKDLKRWLLAHKNPHKIGEDPLVEMNINEEGYSNVKLEKIQAKTHVGLTERENPRYPQDNPYRSAMKLYQAYRKPNSAITEREAQGYTLIYEPDITDEEGKEILLDAPLSNTDKNGDLRKKNIGELKVASIYVKCRDNYDTLNKIKHRAIHQLKEKSYFKKNGFKLTNEAYNYMLTISDTPQYRYWKVLFVLNNID